MQPDKAPFKDHHIGLLWTSQKSSLTRSKGPNALGIEVIIGL